MELLFDLLLLSMPFILMIGGSAIIDIMAGEL